MAAITLTFEPTDMEHGTTRAQGSTELLAGYMDHTAESVLEPGITRRLELTLAVRLRMDHMAHVEQRKLITRAPARTLKRDRDQVCTVVGGRRRYSAEMIGPAPSDSLTVPATQPVLHGAIKAAWLPVEVRTDSSAKVVGATYMPDEMAMHTEKTQTGIGVNGTTAVGTRWRGQTVVPQPGIAC